MRYGGSALTVLGPVEPSSLGVVMPHEHLFVDLTCLFDPPAEASDRSRAFAPFSLEHLGSIRTHYFRHRPNLVLDDEEVAAFEVGLYKAAGGSTIVDVSTPGIGRDPLALARLARRTGVNVVMATGFYVAATHPPEVVAMSETDVANRMIEEIREGAVLRPAGGSDQDWDPAPNHTGVRAWIIKAAAASGGAEGSPRRCRCAARDRSADHRPRRQARRLRVRDPRFVAGRRHGLPAAHSTTATSGSSERRCRTTESTWEWGVPQRAFPVERCGTPHSPAARSLRPSAARAPHRRPRRPLPRATRRSSPC